MRKLMRTISVSAIALIAFAAIPLFAQSKPKIAVYVASNELEEKEKRVLSTKILTTFVQSGQYVAIERGDAFLSGINRERQKQRDGSVDDNQISRLGKEAGVQYVCIADLIDAFGIYSLSARLIDTETAEIVGIGETEMKNLGEISNASDRIYKQITGKKIAKESQENQRTQDRIVAIAIFEPVKKSTTENNNFTTGERWATWALNTVVPGVGSWTIMNDIFGGVVNFSLVSAAFVTLITSEKEVCSEYYNEPPYEDLCLVEDYKYDFTWFYAFYLSHAVWNIVRSATYDKPNRYSMLDPNNFHFVLVPNKNGNSFKPGVFYNAKF